jgi:hypothetical protein
LSLIKLGNSQVCSADEVNIFKEVCFIENHAILGHYRGHKDIGITDVDSSQGPGMQGQKA